MEFDKLSRMPSLNEKTYTVIFYCFTVNFNSVNLTRTYQLMHFHIQ